MTQKNAVAKRLEAANDELFALLVEVHDARETIQTIANWAGVSFSQHEAGLARKAMDALAELEFSLKTFHEGE
ncbi:MAG TPA: hypothetical protein PLX91_11260 [Thermotogota bacterium]|nr:hypothetical protein [Thermotogota bacterium]HOS25827.1 hypothetical protein [Thermotogota bacterium]HPL39932.1 hypothetical protein [Thermotogota bacterium]